MNSTEIQTINQKHVKILNAVKLSVAVSVLAQPFEVLRTSSIMMNHQDIKSINFKGLKQLIYRVYEQEGIKGFFRGSLLALVRNTGSYLIFFTSLEQFQDYKTKKLNGKNPLYYSSYNFMIAAMCRFFSTLAVSPVNVLKTRFEIAGQSEYSSILNAIKSIQQQEGARGFYSGITSTLIRDMPASGIQFSIYQNLLSLYNWGAPFLQQQYSNQLECNKPGNIVISICGASSSMMSLMIVHPFDNIRVRQQCSKDKLNIVQTIKQVISQEGVTGLYKGYLPRLLKKALGGGVIWPLYESFKTQNQPKSH